MSLVIFKLKLMLILLPFLALGLSGIVWADKLLAFARREWDRRPFIALVNPYRDPAKRRQHIWSYRVMGGIFILIYLWIVLIVQPNS